MTAEITPLMRIQGPTSVSRGIVVLLALVLTGLVLPRIGAAQLSEPVSGPPESLPDRPTVYLVTIERGSAVWERFGHNLLWIHDPVQGVDEAYNYGLFSFEQENFLLRFIQGQMRYWMAGESNVPGLLSAYARTERAIEIQELDLSVGQVRELHEFLEWNELPENRFYGYDYYRDNCSTRVRDALDRVLDGRLGTWARDRLTDHSYRDHTLRMSSGLFWVSAGMHFGLGPSVDDPLSAWDAMFIPMELRDHIRDLPSEPGSTSSIVRRQWVFAPGSIPDAPDETPRWIGGFLGGGLVGALLFLGMGSLSTPGRTWLRRSFFGVIVPFLLLVGGMGTLIGLLWAFTDHVDTRGNVNLLYATPIHLALAVLWPMARRRSWARGIAVRAGLLVAALSLLGLGLELFAIPDQTNAEFIWLLVPTNLAMAWAIWRETRGPREIHAGREVPAAPEDEDVPRQNGGSAGKELP